jgi:PPOX class probable F420-dependent enzyme
MMATPLDLLARSPYVLLTTFRRDGTPVPTPVWVVRVGDELLVWTNPTAGKVKRIRRNSRVEIGPCGRGGRPLGRSVPGTARILGSDELGAVVPALIRKYGLVARMTTLPTKLNAVMGRPQRPVGGVAITLDRGTAPGPATA